MNKRILVLCNGIIVWCALVHLANAAPVDKKSEIGRVEVERGQIDVAGIQEAEDRGNKKQVTPLNENESQYRFSFTPLLLQLFTQPTAQHLRQGEVILNLDTRSFFLPDFIPVNQLDNGDTAVNFNTGFSWGITDELQLTLQFQHVDSSSPAKQGDFASERTEDNEAALELKQNLWQNADHTQSLSGVISASWGTRGFRFTGRGEITEINNRDIFVAASIPFTARFGDRWLVNFAPTVAFFKDESAVFFHRLPNDEESSFGTTLGLGGGVTYKVNSRLSIFSDVFLPVTGNNSINRDSGEAARAIAYNGGLRYLVNPRLALDVYATNTFASFAPLSLTADRDLVGVGTNLVFMPDVFPANRRYGDRFPIPKKADVTPITTDGLAFFDGGTLSGGQFLLNLQGGSQGLLTALRYGFLEDLEGGIYLDYVAGETDESEQGLSGKIRLLNQAENAPFTLSLAGTVGLTNQPFINFLENNRDEFDRQDLDKEIPIFTPGGDDIDEGKQLIVTFALPAHYELNGATAVWATPILGYVQRQGTELAGFNLGGSIAINDEVSILGEVGANFVGEGNAFIDDELENAIPWTVGARWQPLSLFGWENSATNINPQLEIYLTNRVGASTWHQLRVRDRNRIAVGIGLSFPF